MELDIRGLGLEPTPVFRRDIERRLRHGLRPFDSRLERVTVRLIRDHGRGRHATRRCQVTVDARGLETVHVAESCRSIETAFSRAATRARRELARELHRGRRLARTGRAANSRPDSASPAPGRRPTPGPAERPISASRGRAVARDSGRPVATHTPESELTGHTTWDGAQP